MSLNRKKKTKPELWGPYRDVWVTGASLGVGGGEDRVDENERSDDLGTETRSFGVAGSDGVGTATESLVRRWLETLDDSGTTDGSETLHNHVENSSGQRQLPSQEQTERNRWVDVSTCNIKHT